jgi:crossover junction endodeoxyribonuclease RusA
VKYTIPGQPIPLARPRFSNNHVWDCQSGEKMVAATNLRFLHKGELLTGPLHVDLKFFMCHKTKHKSWHCVRPDLDNLIKFILDVANGVLYEDDKQVAKITAEKTYDQKARTEITIMEL